jgi:protein phosphatase slingshot
VTIFRIATDDGAPVAVPGCDGCLFIGSIGAAYKAHVLQCLGITHVVCATDNARVLAAVSDTQLHCLRVSVDDRADCSIRPYFTLVKGFVDHARRGGGRVLIHCFQGVSRATTLVCAYMLMSRYGEQQLPWPTTSL